MKSSPLCLALLTLTALAMPVTSITVPVASFESGPGQAVTPPGIFFSIWGLIIIGCIAVAIAGWSDSASAPLRAVAWPLVIAQAGFSMWLVFAGLQSSSVVLSAIGTVLTFGVILASLVIALRRLETVTGRRRWLFAVTVGLYAGWSSAAIWLNAETALPAAWADSSLLQAVAIAGAGATAVVIILGVRPGIAYAATVSWALVGIAISEWRASSWLPLAVVVVGLVIVIAAAARSFRGSRSRVAAHAG